MSVQKNLLINLAYIYDLAFELGLPIVVYSSSTKKEIQNEVLGFIKAKCIEAASDELERNWLEQEMMEYNNHGFFFYPEELNDYVPNPTSTLINRYSFTCHAVAF